MGKRLKNWTPPEEDEVLDQEKPAAKTAWMPPAQDEVVEEPVKKKEPAGVASAIPAEKRGEPSGASTVPVSPESPKKVDQEPPRPNQTKSPSSSESWWDKAVNLWNTIKELQSQPADPKEVTPSPFVNAVKRGLESAKQAKIINPFSGTPDKKQMQELTSIQKRIQELPASDDYQAFNNAKSVTESVTALAKNPSKIIAEITGESLSALASYGAVRMGIGAATGAAMGSVVPGVGTLAGAGEGLVVGMADSSLGLEYSGKFIESLQEQGVDINDVNDLQRAFQDESIISNARSSALKKGIPIAIFDLISGGVAGKIVSKPAKSLIGKVGQGAAEFAVQAVAGGAGEVSGELISGEKLNPSAILSEMIGELGTTPIEASNALLTFNKQARQGGLTPDQQAKPTADVIQEEMKNPNLEAAAETIQAKVEQSPTINDQEAQATPVASTPEEGEVSEDQAQEALPVQEETKERIESIAKRIMAGEVLKKKPEDLAFYYANKEEVDALMRSHEYEATKASIIKKSKPIESELLSKDYTNELTDEEREFLKGKGVPSVDVIPSRLVFKSPLTSIDNKALAASIERKPREVIVDVSRLSPTDPLQKKHQLRQKPDTKKLPEVFLKSDGTYAIVDGHHRVAEQILNGAKEVKVNLYTDDSQNQQRVQSDQREGQEPVQADTEQGTGDQEASPDRILQGTQEITGPESGAYSYGQSTTTVESQGAEPAPREDKIQEESSQQPSGTRTLKIAERILNSDASEAIKRGIREKGADYIPKGLNVTDNEANDLLNLYGNERSETVIRDTKNDLTQDTRTAMAARLYERYKGEADAATDPQAKASLQNKAVDIALFGANQAKEAGRAVNANKIWKEITSDEDMTVLALEKENQATAQKLIEPIQQQITQSKEQFDEQVRRLVEQKVQETVEERMKRAKLITKEQKQKISDAFDSLKIKDVGDTANDVIRVLGAAVWNGSMEAVKRAVLTGADVANAIQAGLDYIRTNHKGDFDENEYRDVVSRGIAPLIPSKKITSNNIDADAVTTPRIKGKKKKQFIEQLVDEYNDKGQITDDRFEQIYAKQLGAKEFSDEDRAMIRELAKVISDTEKFAEVVKNSSGEDLRQNIAKYKALLDQARKANKNLQEFARKPSNVWDTLITIMQGNLLTPLSIVTNVYSNAALQPLRFLSTGVGSLVDRSISGLAKMDLLDKSYKDPTIDLAAVQKGFAPGLWDGTMEGWKQLKEGQLTSDKDLREIQSGFDPVAAVKRWSDQDRELGQKINDAIEGTLGFPAEGMFRLLNFGDKPFRRAAELGRTMEIADKRGLKGDDRIKFIMFPDDASATEIDKAGKQATFQQETELSKRVQKAITDFLNLAQTIPIVGGPIKVLLKSQIPFVKTPLNIIGETFDYALPEITFLRGGFEIWRGNKRTGSVLVGKAIVGWTIRFVARQLFTLGLLSWEEDDDKKGRNIQYDSVPPNSINMSAIGRGLTGQGWNTKDDDMWVNYKKMGVIGILFDNYTTNYFRSQKNNQLESKLQEMFTAGVRMLSSSLEQSFLKGANSLLNAIRDPDGFEAENWAIETIGAVSSIVLPNTVSTISKSSDEYIRDTYNRDFTERLAATFKAKVFLGGHLPPKVNLWGERVTGNPEGRNKFTYYLFDPTKFKNVDTDSYKWKLYEAWKGDNFNSEWLPAMPDRNLKIRGVDMKLNPKEFEQLATFVGQERARSVQAYIKSGWKYQRPEQRIERLKELYAEGRERGKRKFLMQTGWGVMTPKKLEAMNKNR